MKKNIIILIGLLIIGFMVGAIINKNIGNGEQVYEEASEEIPYEQIKVYFECDDNEWIDVIYYNHKEKPSYAELVLSNGKEITVYQAISASGARYLSEDESVEFWTKGEEVVSIKENGEMIFENCAVAYDGEKVQLSNPASVYCQEQGGESEIRTLADGSQKGFCLFDDGSECEEWKFFREECETGNIFCKDLCGDGICQEIVCEAIGCPCAETPETCPQDCL